MLTRRLHAARLLSLATCAILCAGCFNYRTGAPAPPIPLSPGAWPDRDAAVLAPLAEETPDRIFNSIGPPSLEVEGETYTPVPMYRVTGSRLGAGGLLRVYEQPTRTEKSLGEFFESLFYGFTRNASYISSYWFDRFGAAAMDEARDSADRTAHNISESRKGLVLSRPTPDELLIEGYNIALGIPSQVSGDRGILLHVPAIVGNEYEEDIVNRLERDGWTVLHVESDANIRGPGYIERQGAFNARSKRRAELLKEYPDMPSFRGKVSRRGMRIDMPPDQRRRYEEIYREVAQRAAEEIPLPEAGFEIHPGDGLESLAGVIAEHVDQHLADHAYAAEAAVAYVDETLPALADKPIVIIGFSAGSLAAPTIAARLREVHPGRLRALILVGSGAPLLDVARFSTLTDGGLEFSPPDGPEPTPEQYDELRSHYLQSSRLDPYNTAASLRDLPILHVYGARDKIVPSRTAKALNDRLGSPDRLVYSGGHLGLFYFLPSRRERIVLWLNREHEPTP